MLKDAIKHPCLQLALIAFIVLAVSLFFKMNHYPVANALLNVTVIFASIPWIIILRLIIRNPFLDRQAKLFWMALSLLVPVIGTIIYVVRENRKLGI